MLTLLCQMESKVFWQYMVQRTRNVFVCTGPEFFHAFTGCDDVQSFYKVRKAKFWTFWLAQSKAGETTLSNIFNKFSNCPMNIEVDKFDTWCNFVYEACLDKTSHVTSTPNVNIWMLGPSPSRILQHINRACIQAGYFWKLHEIET